MTETKIYTEAQATDEALLLFFRKTRRITDDATFGKIWNQLGPCAQRALFAAEARADMLRDDSSTYFWPMPDDDEEEVDGEE